MTIARTHAVAGLIAVAVGAAAWFSRGWYYALIYAALAAIAVEAISHAKRMESQNAPDDAE